MGSTLEAWLREPVRAHLAAQGFDVRFEVPVNGRFADILAKRDDELIAVELKLTAWKDALHQAMHYQLAAQRSYVAMPLHEAVMPLRQRSRLERQGVGLLAVSHLGEVRTLLEAKESNRRLPFLTQHLQDVWFALPPAAPTDQREESMLRAAAAWGVAAAPRLAAEAAGGHGHPRHAL